MWFVLLAGRVKQQRVVCVAGRAREAADRRGPPEHRQRAALRARRGRQAARARLSTRHQVSPDRPRQPRCLMFLIYSNTCTNDCHAMCAVELVCCCCSWIYSSLPVNKQMLALSATYPEALAQQLTDYMRNPTFIRLNVTDPA